MLMEAYITALAAFLPNAPVSNDAIEDVLGRIGGRPARNKDLILARNGIVHRPSALDPQTGRLTHTNAELTAEAVQRLVDCEEIAWGETDFWRAERRRPIRSFPAMRRWCRDFYLAERAKSSFPRENVVRASALKYAFTSLVAGTTRKAVVAGSELSSALFGARRLQPQTQAWTDAPAPLRFQQEFLR